MRRETKAFAVHDLSQFPLPSEAEQRAIRAFFRGTATKHQQIMVARYMAEQAGVALAPDPHWTATQSAYANGLRHPFTVLSDIAGVTLLNTDEEDYE